MQAAVRIESRYTAVAAAAAVGRVAKADCGLKTKKISEKKASYWMDATADVVESATFLRLAGIRIRCRPGCVCGERYREMRRLAWWSLVNELRQGARFMRDLPKIVGGTLRRAASGGIY